MSEHPWLRPLPAALVMMVGGFWLSFFAQGSDAFALSVALVVLIFAAPVYYLAYAVWLVIRRSRGKPPISATPWWVRVLLQAVFFAFVAVAIGLTWALLAGLILVFGAPPEDVNQGLLTAGNIAVAVLALGLAVIVPLETLYSALGKRKEPDAGRRTAS